jgi:hypothetical protein
MSSLARVEHHIGFTGTRNGMSVAQKMLLGVILVDVLADSIKKGVDDNWFHHGDCVGADDEACEMARDMGFKIYRHPPIDRKYQRNYIKTNQHPNHGNFDATDPAYSYQGRNHRIVIKSSMLIGAPLTDIETGGTWQCLNLARRILKPIIIMHHDGTWTEERVTNRKLLDYLRTHNEQRVGPDK